MAGDTLQQVGLWCHVHRSFVTVHVKHCDNKWLKAGQEGDCELQPVYVKEAE